MPSPSPSPTPFLLLLLLLASPCTTATPANTSTGIHTHTHLARRWAPGIAFQGKMTYYGDGYKSLQNGADPPPLGPQNGGWYGACYNTFWQNPQPLLPKNFNAFAALNKAQFQLLTPQLVCGSCLLLTHPSTKSTTLVQIVDSCPGCPAGGIDVSHAAFAALLKTTPPTPPAASSSSPWDQTVHIGTIPNVIWQVASCKGLVADPVFRVDGVPADTVIAQKKAVVKRGVVRLARLEAVAGVE
ncbi:hypothetical protein DFJ77DRAFT_440552 [Powellomyces hirtus]|nr:hypothetical protein DFJ77DRAFT_440552 [Powellomyces hirtus]